MKRIAAIVRRVKVGSIFDAKVEPGKLSAHAYAYKD